jgi:CrcB protein
MKLLLLACAGGAIGAGARFLVGVGAARWLGTLLPWGTLIVNVAGSFLMGVVVAMIASRFAGSVELRTFLATGVLGGFTTFSAFSLDFYALAGRGETALAFGYALVSVVLSIAALYAGFAVARGFEP